MYSNWVKRENLRNYNSEKKISTKYLHLYFICKNTQFTSWKHPFKVRIIKLISIMLSCQSNTQGYTEIFNDFKNKQKSVWPNVFWYVKVCIFQKCIQYTIHWDKTQILKNIPSEKINSTKNAPFFSFTSSNSSQFYLNLWFLHELKHKVLLSKTLCGIFHFWFRFVLIKVYIFTILKFNDICVSWSSPKIDLVTNFSNLENRTFENVSFSQ